MTDPVLPIAPDPMQRTVESAGAYELAWQERQDDADRRWEHEDPKDRPLFPPLFTFAGYSPPGKAGTPATPAERHAPAADDPLLQGSGGTSANTPSQSE